MVRKQTWRAAILVAAISAVPMSANAGMYYKLGSDAASRKGFMIIVK